MLAATGSVGASRGRVPDPGGGGKVGADERRVRRVHRGEPVPAQHVNGKVTPSAAMLVRIEEAGGTGGTGAARHE